MTTANHTLDMSFTRDAALLLIISSVAYGSDSHACMQAVTISLPNPECCVIMHLLTMSPPPPAIMKGVSVTSGEETGA